MICLCLVTFLHIFDIYLDAVSVSSLVLFIADRCFGVSMQPLYPFYYRWTFRLLLVWELLWMNLQCLFWYRSFCGYMFFFFSWITPRSGITGYRLAACLLLKKVSCQDGFTIFLSHRQWMGFPVAPRPHRPQSAVSAGLVDVKRISF